MYLFSGFERSNVHKKSMVRSCFKCQVPRDIKIQEAKGYRPTRRLLCDYCRPSKLFFPRFLRDSLLVVSYKHISHICPLNLPIYKL